MKIFFGKIAVAIENALKDKFPEARFSKHSDSKCAFANATVGRALRPDEFDGIGTLAFEVHVLRSEKGSVLLSGKVVAAGGFCLHKTQLLATDTNAETTAAEEVGGLIEGLRYKLPLWLLMLPEAK